MSASISCQHWWFCSAISPAGRPREQYGLHRCHPSSCGKKAPPTRRGFWAELYSQSFCAPHLLSGTVLLSYCWVSTTAERRGGGTRGARRENRRQMRENRQKMRENRQETVSKWGQTGSKWGQTGRWAGGNELENSKWCEENRLQTSETQNSRRQTGG